VYKICLHSYPQRRKIQVHYKSRTMFDITPWGREINDYIYIYCITKHITYSPPHQILIIIHCYNNNNIHIIYIIYMYSFPVFFFNFPLRFPNNPLRRSNDRYRCSLFVRCHNVVHKQGQQSRTFLPGFLWTS